MQWKRRGWATVGRWGAIVAAILILLCCAPSAIPADRFDYHSVRGRQPGEPSTLANDSPPRQPTIPSDIPSAALPLSGDEFAAATKQFCVRCHGGETTEGDLDLTSFTESHEPPTSARILQQIRDRIAHREMPPENEPSPGDTLRRRLAATLDAHLRERFRLLCK